MAGADVNRIGFALKEYRTTAPVEDMQVFSRHPLAVEFDYNTLFRNEADASTFGQQILALRKVDRWNWACYITRGNYPTLEVGQTVTLTYPRYGFQNGAEFILKKIRRDAGALFDEIVLYGPRGLDYSGHLLAFDFTGGEYWLAGARAMTPVALPGYIFQRAGEQGVRDVDNGIDWFASGVPAINGVGYHSFEDLTNLTRHSNSAELQSLVDVTVAANAGKAPDGTTTMDKIIPNSGPVGWASVFVQGGYGAGTFTQSAFVKAAGYPRFFMAAYDQVSQYMNVGFDLLTGKVVPGSTPGGAVGYIHDYGGGLFRIVMIAATAGNYGGSPTTGPMFSVRPSFCTNFNENFTGDGVSGGLIWGMQTIAGSFPDGGPVIRTAGSQILLPYSAMFANIKAGGAAVTGDWHVEEVVTNYALNWNRQAAHIYNTGTPLDHFFVTQNIYNDMILYGKNNQVVTSLSGFKATGKPLAYIYSMVDSTKTIIFGARCDGVTVIAAPVSSIPTNIAGLNGFNPDYGTSDAVIKFAGVKAGSLTATQMSARLAALLGE